MKTIKGLQTNWLDYATGIDTPPVFGWYMESDEVGAAQRSYRIVVSKNSSMKTPVWDSGKVVSSVSVAIPYAGKELEVATRYYWRVEVCDEAGKKFTSSVAFFDTGLIRESNWEGSAWIMAKPLEGENPHPAMALRKIVKNAKELQSAKWFVSGLGVFEAYVNGQRVSNLSADGTELYDELKPGFTDARKLRQYFSYDVTHLFATEAGKKNILGAIVTSGWWSDQITGKIGKQNAFRGQLILTYADGVTETIGTDTTWSAAFDGPCVKGEIHWGEDIDARIGMSWFSDLKISDAKLPKGWGKAVINDEFKGRIETLQGPSVRVRDDLEIKPVKVTVIDAEHFDHVVSGERHGKARILREYAAGEKMVLHPGEILVADLAQNSVGRERIVLKGEKGTVLTVRHSEFLNDGDGLIERGNDGPEGTPYYQNLRAARATTTFVLSGEGEELCNPIFSFYGGSYICLYTTETVEIRSVAMEIVNSVPQGADTAWLTTSDKLVNRLIQNCRWGHYGNYLSVPTDCPQRDERLGWTADTQVFSAAAAYDGVSYGFLSKFMRDMRDAQGEEGGFPGVAPYAQYGNDRCKVGWSDAAVVVPYNMWKAYGDTTIIHENYAALKRYMDLFEHVNGPVPQWGDWLAYERNDWDLQYYLCLAYCIWDLRMMAEMAEAIGKREDAEHFRKIARFKLGIMEWIYLEGDGIVQERYRCQTAYLFSLMLDFPKTEEAREATKQMLRDNIESHGNRLQTGFLGTAIIMDVLSNNGMTDLAYKLLLQREEPSWLYSVLQGATTMWERWNSYTKDKGFGNAGMNSFNHYAYGAVLEWMMGSMAGIAYDPLWPGYHHFRLAPVIDPSMKAVDGAYRTPYGIVKSAWAYEGKTWVLNATIPANTTAEVALPCGKGARVTINGKALSKLSLTDDGIALKEKRDGAVVLDAVSCCFTAKVTTK